MSSWKLKKLQAPEQVTDMNDFKKYACAAVHHVIQNLPDRHLDKVSSIVLFGSVAQDRATKDSDVDLFFDTSASKTQEKELKKNIDNAVESFYISNLAIRFKTNGLDNKISVTVGNLDEWKDLKRSIISTGIVLFGRYTKGVDKAQLAQNFIIEWESPKLSRGAFLNKLYGYSVKNKKYVGLIKKLECTKIGKSALMIPSKNKDTLINFMEKQKINYKILEVYL